MRRLCCLCSVVACAPTEVIEPPDQIGASFIVFEKEGEGRPRLVASSRAPVGRPFVSTPGAIEVGVLAFDRSLEELGLIEGSIEEPVMSLPRRAVPRPDRAWSLRAGEMMKTYRGEVPDSLAELRIPAPGCSPLRFSERDDVVYLPGARGEVRILAVLDERRIFVATASQIEAQPLTDWRWFLVQDGEPTPIVVRGPPQVYASWPSERGCMWLTQSSTMAACFGPRTDAPEEPWVERDRIELPNGDGEAIVKIGGVDLPDARELLFLTGRGRLFRITTSVEVLDARLDPPDELTRTVRYLGPASAVATHARSLFEYAGGRLVRTLLAPPDVAELVGISAMTPTGILISGHAGIDAALSVFEPGTDTFLPFAHQSGGEAYLKGVHFRSLEPALGSWFAAADGGKVLEWVAFDSDLDGERLGWDFCPPTQLARSDFFFAVGQGDSLWLGGNEGLYNAEGRIALFRVRAQ